MDEALSDLLDVALAYSSLLPSQSLLKVVVDERRDAQFCPSLLAFLNHSKLSPIAETLSAILTQELDQCPAALDRNIVAALALALTVILRRSNLDSVSLHGVVHQLPRVVESLLVHTDRTARGCPHVQPSLMFPPPHLNRCFDDELSTMVFVLQSRCGLTEDGLALKTAQHYERASHEPQYSSVPISSWSDTAALMAARAVVLLIKTSSTITSLPNDTDDVELATHLRSRIEVLPQRFIRVEHSTLLNGTAFPFSVPQLGVPQTYFSPHYPIGDGLYVEGSSPCCHRMCDAMLLLRTLGDAEEYPMEQIFEAVTGLELHVEEEHMKVPTLVIIVESSVDSMQLNYIEGMTSRYLVHCAVLANVGLNVMWRLCRMFQVLPSARGLHKSTAASGKRCPLLRRRFSMKIGSLGVDEVSACSPVHKRDRGEHKFAVLSIPQSNSEPVLSLILCGATEGTIRLMENHFWSHFYYLLSVYVALQGEKKSVEPSMELSSKVPVVVPSLGLLECEWLHHLEALKYVGDVLPTSDSDNDEEEFSSTFPVLGTTLPTVSISSCFVLACDTLHEAIECVLIRRHMSASGKYDASTSYSAMCQCIGSLRELMLIPQQKNAVVNSMSGMYRILAPQLPLDVRPEPNERSNETLLADVLSWDVLSTREEELYRAVTIASLLCTSVVTFR